MSSALHNMYDTLLNDTIEAAKNETNKVYKLYDRLLTKIGTNNNFTMKTIQHGKHNIISLFTLKDFTNYCMSANFQIDEKKISIKIIVDETGLGFKEIDPITVNDLSVIKYYWLHASDCDQSCEKIDEELKRIFDSIKESIEDHHKRVTRIKVDHVLTGDEFAEKVQKLFHPDDGGYLFADPISWDQANYWFYDKIKKKIEEHPRIWKWFFKI